MVQGEATLLVSFPSAQGMIYSIKPLCQGWESMLADQKTLYRMAICIRDAFKSTCLIHWEEHLEGCSSSFS